MAPLKLAIVGWGLSVGYVASRSLSLLPESSSRASHLKFRMYDHLWAPGIQSRTIRRSPDHPEAKVRLERLRQRAHTHAPARSRHVQVHVQVRRSLCRPTASLLRRRQRWHPRAHLIHAVTVARGALAQKHPCVFLQRPHCARSRYSAFPLRCHSCTGVQRILPGRLLRSTRAGLVRHTGWPGQCLS